MTKKRSIGVLLFNDFELLDVFGPLEMFGAASDHFEIFMIAESGREVKSHQGPRSVIDYNFSDNKQYDIVLVPGGIGTREEVNNPALINWLVTQSRAAEYVISVCTGSALLAKANMLDGKSATSNKIAFDWVSSQGKRVNWEKKARWVEDGKFFTSSGVSAGMDMALALIEKLLGSETAEHIATYAEYEWHRDSTIDPFALEN